MAISHLHFSVFFFFNDPATTEIYTLSLHDALPIWASASNGAHVRPWGHSSVQRTSAPTVGRDRKSTRLNSSHTVISYAVFCLKKKKKKKNKTHKTRQKSLQNES